MKNRKCPQRKGCWGYVNGVCDGCAIGKTINGLRSKIDRLKKQNETLTIQRNAWALAAKAVKEDTVRKMESLLIDEVFKVARCQRTCDEPNVTDQEVRAIIKQIAKEMVEGANEKIQ